jgi:hypothetical protein
VTVAVSCSIADAVSSRLDACASVRADKSRLPLAISLDAVAIVSVLSRTLRMVVLSDATKRLKPSASAPTSSLLSTVMRRLRSPLPSAISPSICAARATGAAIAALTR